MLNYYVKATIIYTKQNQKMFIHTTLFILFPFTMFFHSLRFQRGGRTRRIGLSYKGEKEAALTKEARQTVQRPPPHPPLLEDLKLKCRKKKNSASFLLELTREPW